MRPLNVQPVAPVKRSASGDLEVKEVFLTIQGEGPYSGSAAVFLRLAGCNLKCPQCDTDYSYPAHIQSPSTILDRAQELWRGPDNKKLLVITGGEPFRQNIAPLTRLMASNRWQVQIETNGTLYDDDFPYVSDMVTIVCSPKTPRLNLDLVPHVSAYKYVLTADAVSELDGLPLSVLGMKMLVARPDRPSAPVFLQPADVGDPDQNAKNVQACIDSALKHGHTFGLQLHKLIGLP